MAIKVIGIILILVGIAGLVLPIMPGVLPILIGVLLLFNDKRSKIRQLMPERIPALAAIFYSSFAPKMFSPYHAKIVNELGLSDGERVLDIGTGPGSLPIEIALRSNRVTVVGIDLSEKMIEIADKNKALVGAPENVEFAVMDAKALQFADNFFDLVISTGSFHHWKQPVMVFNEIFRCLKPGGKAFIYDGNADATNEEITQGMHRLGGIFPTPSVARYILHIHGYTEDEYRVIIRDVVSKSLFKDYSFEKRGILTRITLSRNLQ